MTIPSERTSREIRSGRINHRPPSFVVTLVALAIIFALAWTFFLRSGPAAPTPGVEGIKGTYTWEAPSPSAGQTGTFSAVASGNAGGEAKSDATVLGAGPPAAAYDAVTRTESLRVGHGPAVTEVRTIGAWPPVWRVAIRSPLDYQGLAAIVRTAVEDRDAAVGIKPLEDGDRAVWRAALTMSGRQIELVVDQQTGLVTWCSDGTSTFTANVDWGSPPPAGQTYSIEVPGNDAKVETKTAASYAYAASPAAAGHTAGYDPLVSDLAPDGYALKAVATTDGAYRPLVWFGAADRTVPIAPTLREAVVAGLYTRGLTWFTMEQAGPQLTHAIDASQQALLQPTAGSRLSFQQTTLQYGSLKGATASTWYQESGPTLFVRSARRSVFITGALTRQELIAFAEGLKPVPANAGR
jgi:hypothetical protein